MPSSVIPLESIQIASTCHADWNAMQKVNGDGCVRFCPSCGKNVYDLSGFTREQAIGLIAAKEGNLCMRLHRRADGTIITNDCPVGKSARIKRNMFSQMLVAFVGFGTATVAVGGVLFHRIADKASTIVPKPTQAKVVAVATSTPTPLTSPTPSPTRVPRLGPTPETIIISNAPPEVSPVAAPTPCDPSVSVTMGAPLPPMPEPTPTTSSVTDAVITVPDPAVNP